MTNLPSFSHIVMFFRRCCSNLSRILILGTCVLKIIFLQIHNVRLQRGANEATFIAACLATCPKVERVLPSLHWQATFVACTFYRFKTLNILATFRSTNFILVYSFAPTFIAFFSQHLTRQVTKYFIYVIEFNENKNLKTHFRILVLFSAVILFFIAKYI